MKNKKYVYLRSCLATVAISMVMQLGISTSVLAEVKGPGWILGTAGTVSLEESRVYYQNRSPIKTYATGNGVVTMNGTSSPSEVTSEINELARALHHDPKQICEYIFNKIDYVPYFGSLKGATQTLLDGSGNDFDQASLLIALLRASGYTANYYHGAALNNDITFAQWAGVSDWLSINRPAVTDLAMQVFGLGGIPMQRIDSTRLLLERVCVKATIDGADYYFDLIPYRGYIYLPTIDIAGAAGYNRADLIDAASSGANITTDYAQNINEASLDAKLTEYAMNLVNTLRSQHPNDSVRDIVGGRKIVEAYLTGLPTSVPYYNTETWAEIPSAYIATLRIQHEGIDHTFQVPEITGKRLTVTYAGSNYVPELRLDGTLIASGNPTTKGNKYDMIITIDHPYAYQGGTHADQTGTYKCVSGSTYAIVSDFAGGVTDNLIRKRQKTLSRNMASGLADMSEQVMGETLNVLGLTFLKETHLSDQLYAQITNTILTRHHAVGVMAQETGYYVDVKAAFYAGTVKNQGGPYSPSETFIGADSINSSFEHTILEQLGGSDNPGVSTIKLMQLASNQGNKMFWANSGNYASIQPQLQNYSSETLNKIQSDINAGHVLILPENGQLVLNQWHGTGYASKYLSADKSTGSISMVIGGDYYGGFGSFLQYFQPEPIYYDIWSTLPDISYDIDIPSPVSFEPVDMATGAYLFDHTDITMGGKAPMGLEFHRAYNSSRSMNKRSMGYGWQHNYDISVNKVSDGDPGLGMRTPVDVASLITDLYISQDLAKNEDNITGWMVIFLAHKWATDQLIDNAVSANIGGQMTEYIKLPDGSYNNPPGVTTELVDNGNGTFSLKERFGTQMDFDAGGRISQLRDVDNNTLSFDYTGTQLTSVRDTVSRTLSIGYTGENITSATDSEGRSVGYEYDDDDLVAFTDLDGKRWSYGYDPEHQMVSLRNPLNVTTATNVYDSFGRVKTQTVPRDGSAATYNFYFSGFRNAEEDPYGRLTIYYLDEKGRTYKAENALQNRQAVTFDGQNHVISVKNARFFVTTYSYDGNQNLTKITDATDKATNNVYDPENHLTDIYDPLDHNTHYDYDAEHHLILTTDAETNTSRLTYYPNGQVETSTDGKGTVTTCTYDTNNHPHTSYAGLHPSIHYDYDTIGRMRSITDQEGAQTTFTYNTSGSVIVRHDPLDKETRYVYDDAGRVTSRTDRNDNTINYSYTPSDKLKVISYPDGSSVTYAYNLHDKLIGMKDSIGQTTYIYDAVYRVKSFTNPFGQTVSYEYDEVGNVTQVIYPGNLSVTYTYDALNRLQSVKNWLDQTTVYTYDDAGRLTSVSNFNGTVTSYGYDKANRLTALQNITEPLGKTISSYAYTLDGNGNKTGVEQKEPLPPVMPIEVTAFVYNSKKNRLLSAGASTFVYDNEGQLSGGGSATYGFDYEHRLTSIGGVDSVTYLYDGSGNRLQATRNGVITRYIYDGAGNLLAETDGFNTITRYYIYSRGLIAMVTPAGQVYTYHYNGIGSTIAMSDMNKNIVNKYFYTPYGKLTNQNEVIGQPFKYVGSHGVLCEPSGLYYMKARYYDPETSRFISEDPIGLDAGVNLYAYCNNNPINFVDPSGLCWTGETDWVDVWEDLAFNGLAGLISATQTRTFEDFDVYLHGTDAVSAANINVTGLRMDSFVTIPTAIDPATSKIATALTPAEFRAFVSQPRPGVGDWFVLVAAPKESVRPLSPTAGGAPQWQICGEHVILDVYKNTNQ